ncbi:MAG: hypothetical protein OXI22_04130 [Defluviicoccus sp.]|nr:hypothetical protein [Defluviicoccus sp.]MDE0383050.1 hypothetical protein [Defluviicoccus sp.]
MFGVDRRKIARHAVDVLVATMLIGALVVLAMEALKQIACFGCLG